MKKKGKYLLDQLSKLKKEFGVIKEVRGKGLMLGVELKANAQPIFQEALERKGLINYTHVNVLRLLPALNVKKEEIDKGIKVLRDNFKNFK